MPLQCHDDDVYQNNKNMMRTRLRIHELTFNMHFVSCVLLCTVALYLLMTSNNNVMHSGTLIAHDIKIILLYNVLWLICDIMHITMNLMDVPYCYFVLMY